MPVHDVAYTWETVHYCFFFFFLAIDVVVNDMRCQLLTWRVSRADNPLIKRQSIVLKQPGKETHE